MKRSMFVKLLVLVVPMVIVGTALAERQPHMAAALASLEQARAALEKASADKGGHRVKAIELTTAAIEEVKKGIAFDNKH